MANFAVNGKAPGADLARGFLNTGNAAWTLGLTLHVTNLPTGKLIVQVKDLAGNMSVIEISFSVNSVAPPQFPASEIILDNLAVGVRDANRSFTGQWCLSAAANKFGSYSIHRCGAARDTYRCIPSIAPAAT